MAIALTARLSRLWSTTVMSSAASGASPDDEAGEETAVGLTCVAVKVMHSFDSAGTGGPSDTVCRRARRRVLRVGADH
ncbi:hypothetical protein IST4113_01307 [Burkholderia cenocepacia]|nr:hypothetical protein IST4134_01309 [Burkholderia cenocepacia]CAB5088828.1 hypothetical protein IST4113_01307 [Burkholderia cenocepacia]CAB5292621.1 hypothetical protein IST4103_01306 [Burkholderia cenocepacia]